MEDYWRKENPDYIRLKSKIEQKQNRISSGIITNNRTLSYAKKEIQILESKLTETPKYLK